MSVEEAVYFPPMFDNTYLALPERFYARVKPSHASDPSLLAWNQELAEELSLQGLPSDVRQTAQLFCGNELLPGAEPIALAYAGHQFGQFVPSGQRTRLHLKL